MSEFPNIEELRRLASSGLDIVVMHRDTVIGLLHDIDKFMARLTELERKQEGK